MAAKSKTKKPSKPKFTAETPESKQALARVRRREHMEAVVDGLQNAVTGLGTERSKVTHAYYEDEPDLDPVYLDRLYKQNDLVRVIVGKIVEDAMRDGFEIERDGENVDPEADHEMAEAIMKRFKELKGRTLVKRGATWGRLYGAGGVILGVAGGGPLDTELDDDLVTKVVYLRDFDWFSMSPIDWYPDGRVKVYKFHPQQVGNKPFVPVDIRESRLLTFPGAMTTNLGKIRRRMWDDSVIQAVYKVLVSFDQMWSNVDNMFADASQAVFKMQGLIQSLAEADGEGEKDVQTRLALMDMMRSAARAIFLEAGDGEGKGGEDFEVIERQGLGQLDGTIQAFFIRLACAARMPLTVLLGMSPSGMDATGESDLILHFNTVDVYRKDALEPHIERLIRLIARELGDEAPDSWQICWPELARPKPLDVATADNMVVTSLVALVTAQVLLPEEAALSLRRALKAVRLTIDNKARVKALKEGLKELENREMTGPGKEEPPPQAGGKGVKPGEKKSERKTPSKAARRQV